MKTYGETISKMIVQQTNLITKMKNDTKNLEAEIAGLRKNSIRRPALEGFLANLNFKLQSEEEKLAQMKKFENEIGAIENVEARIAALVAERESIYAKIGNYASLIFCILRSEQNI
jgi:hypothetical protein